VRQFGGILANALGVAGTVTILDPHIAADGPTQFLQTLPECRAAGLVLGIILRQGGCCANDAHPVGLLCVR
jgi:hypothetical protein